MSKRKLAALGAPVSKGSIKGEQKYKDNGNGGGTPLDLTTTATITDLIGADATGIEQGAGASQRIGNKINWKSLNMRYFIYNSDATAPAKCRVMIVYDKNNNGTAATAAQILEAATDVNSHRNLAFSGRFITLSDKTYCPSGVSTASPMMLADEVHIPLRDLPCRFTGSSGTYTSTEQGALWMLTMGTPSGASVPTITWRSRLRYVDA